jgi:tetratricopeptide (TPR) repeat protein
MTTAIPTPHAALVAIDAAVCHERWLQARALAAAALRDHPSPALHLAAARLDLARGGGRPAGAADDPGAASADEVLLELATLDAAAHDAGLGGLWHELRAAAWCRKRLPALAREAVAAGEAACGPSPGLAVARATALLLGDDRPAARDAYRAALALAPDHGAARLGLGELLVAMAAFDDARQELREVPRHARQWGAAQRALAGVAAALGERAVDVELRATIVRELSTSDWAQGDGISLGVALAAAGPARRRRRRAARRVDDRSRVAVGRLRAGAAQPARARAGERRGPAP